MSKNIYENKRQSIKRAKNHIYGMATYIKNDKMLTAEEKLEQMELLERLLPVVNDYEIELRETEDFEKRLKGVDR